MAIKINFRNGQYNQDDFNNEFKAIVGESIIITKDLPTSLKVTQNNPLGLKVLVHSGSAFVNGEYVVSDSNELVVVEKNTSGSTRKDIIVFDLDENRFKAIKGTATAPNPMSTQIILAEISVKNDSLSVLDGDIVDKRYTVESIADKPHTGGHGSKSNADMLDGKHASDFALLSMLGKFGNECTYVGDMTRAFDNGFYRYDTATVGKPGGATYGVFLHLKWNQYDWYQILLDVNCKLFVRNYVNGKFSSWVEK